ncbi:MAG TPA: glycosyltransferase family 2 protein, partial [Bryobacteraceae bacterium]|nr:glycosyltransferase family 2 protein [Bryobacteraceae bacterium]
MASVSVIIPARNSEATLARTLDSLRAQSIEHWEAIVVNDGSSDGTPAIAREYAERDGRIRVITGAGKGVSAARNCGIAAARCDWLVFLDADDELRPDYLLEMCAGLEQRSALLV